MRSVTEDVFWKPGLLLPRNEVFCLDPKQEPLFFKRKRLNCLSQDFSSEGAPRRVDGRVELQQWEQRSYSRSLKALSWASKNFCADRKSIRGFKDVRGANLSTRPRLWGQNPKRTHRASTMQRGKEHPTDN